MGLHAHGHDVDAADEADAAPSPARASAPRSRSRPTAHRARRRARRQRRRRRGLGVRPHRQRPGRTPGRSSPASRCGRRCRRIGFSVALSANGNTAADRRAGRRQRPRSGLGLHPFDRDGTGTQQGAEADRQRRDRHGTRRLLRRPLGRREHRPARRRRTTTTSSGRAGSSRAPGTTWAQQGGKLTGSGESGQGFFGVSVGRASDGNTALIGASEDNNSAGAAFAFARSGASWSQQGGKLTGSGATGHGALRLRRRARGRRDERPVGGPGDNGNVGAAWQFFRSGTAWVQQGGKLTGGGESGAADFGAAVALSSDGGTALSGGSEDASGAGATWAFVTTAPGAPAGVIGDTRHGPGDRELPVAARAGQLVHRDRVAGQHDRDRYARARSSCPGSRTESRTRSRSPRRTSAGTGPASAPSNAVTPFGAAGRAHGGLGDRPATATRRSSSPRRRRTAARRSLWYTVTASPGQTASGSGSPITVYGLTNGVSAHVHGHRDERCRRGTRVDSVRPGHARRRRAGPHPDPPRRSAETRRARLRPALGPADPAAGSLTPPVRVASQGDRDRGYSATSARA